MSNTTMNEITLCPWLNNKRWVYSITFDEALSDLHRFAIPILEEYGVPGHLEVVAGQLGQTRNLGSSSYNGFKHMGAGELREMLDRGWGVGNHSWSHTVINAANADREIMQAKRVIEEAIGQEITVYCAPGCNANMNEVALNACRQSGYLGAMGIFDGLNRPDDEDWFWIKRIFLHDQGPCEHDSEFDPFRRISHARRDRGWIIDYAHCPLETPVHPRKDCSAEQLRERIETVLAEGRGDVWLARVEDAIDYRLLRRNTSITNLQCDVFQIAADSLPPQVRKRTITLSFASGVKAVDLDGRVMEPAGRGKPFLLNVDLHQAHRLAIRK